MAKITLSGFDGLAKALEEAEKLFLPIASRAIAKSLNAIHEEISPYPEQPDRMRSGRLNRYVRGQGTYPASAFKRDVNEPGGFRTTRVRRAQIRMTSQQMDKKYRMEVHSDGNSIQGELRNDADYSGYVVGPLQGDPHQVAFHTETGWPNEDDAINAAMPVLMSSIDDAISEFIGTLAGSV